MIFQNQQANIKNVNGAIADVFANRPAPQTTYYLFYSTDTQEIFYDNGAWILIGTGGGGVVNIYNSDGTLTGNRFLNTNGNDLKFEGLGYGLTFEYTLFPLFRTYIGTYNTIKARIFTETDVIVGYGGIQLITDEIRLIQEYNPINQKIIKTTYQSNDIGFKLDFANGVYLLGDPGSFANSINFVLDDAGRRITTGDVSGVNGIDINFATASAKFGFLNTANSTNIFVDDVSRYISTYIAGIQKGINLDLGNNLYQFGNVVSDNFTYLQIDDTNQIIYTINQGTQIGLKLDFANNEFYLGKNFVSNNDFVGFGADCANGLFNIGDLNNIWNFTYLQIDSYFSIIKTSSGGNDIGLKLDFANSEYRFGQLTGGNENLVEFIDSTQRVEFKANGNTNGILLDHNVEIYTFGKITGGNTTWIAIDDPATYPVQINGTNVLSGSSAGSSGQHLKIKINGTDYKIKLENP